MPIAKGRSRSQTLTSETRLALIYTLNGLIELACKLIDIHQFSYVLFGQFQSDDLEREFGKFRQMSGGCYFLSVEQVFMSMRLRHLSLFSRLEIAWSSTDDHPHSPCCTNPFTNDEMAAVEDVLIDIYELSDEEAAALFYICGYVAKKENIPEVSMPNECPDSEFLTEVNRGRLQYPPDWLFHFSK